MIPEPLRAYLSQQVNRFERPAFIASDPIAIPHGFENPLDQELIGLYTALLAWGQRQTILNKLHELCKRMEYKPRDFVYNFVPERDAAKLEGFKHRTFQPIDAIWLTKNLSGLLKQFGTIEAAFSCHLKPSAINTEKAIQGFSDSVLGIHPETPLRLRKHLARPLTGSACKRINMYLRWMVRPGPVDFGIWQSIRTDQLILPLDVHSGRQARALGMLSRKQNDWKAALELTENCRLCIPDDPCSLDYAFFGMGVNDVVPDPLFTGKNRLAL